MTRFLYMLVDKMQLFYECQLFPYQYGRRLSLTEIPECFFFFETRRLMFHSVPWFFYQIFLSHPKLNFSTIKGGLSIWCSLRTNMQHIMNPAWGQRTDSDSLCIFQTPWEELAKHQSISDSIVTDQVHTQNPWTTIHPFQWSIHILFKFFHPVFWRPMK